MKRTMRLSQTSIIMLIAGTIAGFFLLLKPGATLGTAVRFAGWALIIDGAIKVIRRFSRGVRNVEEHFPSAVEIIGGIAIMAIARFLIRLIPIVSGILLILLAVYRGRTALQLRNHVNGNLWILTLGLSIISAVIGVYVLLNPTGFTNTLIRILGAYLLIECVESLFACYNSK